MSLLSLNTLMVAPRRDGEPSLVRPKSIAPRGLFQWLQFLSHLRDGETNQVGDRFTVLSPDLVQRREKGAAPPAAASSESIDPL